MNRSCMLILLSFLIGGLTSTALFAELGLEKAIFAGGCFWCMEADFQKVPGVKEVVSGYSGGTEKNPTYKDYGKKKHIEVVQITYEPSINNI